VYARKDDRRIVTMGWVYNLVTPDPNSHVARVIGVCLAFSLSALVAVTLRMYIRVFVKRSVWVDDYACCFSAVLSVAYASIIVARELPLVVSFD
jgi:hypothetical protein